MTSEWDKLWENYQLICDEETMKLFSFPKLPQATVNWLRNIKAEGDKLKHRTDYLEGLTDKDAKLLTEAMLENKVLKKKAEKWDESQKPLDISKEIQKMKDAGRRPGLFVFQETLDKMVSNNKKLNAIGDLIKGKTNHHDITVGAIKEALGE